MKLLKRTQFGNPILRQKADLIEPTKIMSKYIQTLITDMVYTLKHKKYGVGLAAPQVGEPIALSVIAIKPTPTRPELKEESLVIINPEITTTYGKRVALWEGCISGPNLYAKAIRYKKIRLSFYDDKGRQCEKDFDGFMAHVIQHEVDHLNGVLFVDRVKDTKTYMTFSEYKKMHKSSSRPG